MTLGKLKKSESCCDYCNSSLVRITYRLLIQFYKAMKVQEKHKLHVKCKFKCRNGSTINLICINAINVLGKTMLFIVERGGKFLEDYSVYLSVSTPIT